MKRCVALMAVLLLVSLWAGAAEAPVTRGTFITALWQADGSVPPLVPVNFSDVGQNDPWTEGVGWAQAGGLVLGTGQGCFEPGRPITREEAATILRRYWAWQGRDTFLPDGVAECNDGEDISSWADDSLYWACDAKLIAWSEQGRLDPLGGITPTQLTQILYRAVGGGPAPPP